jgi:hypothetical protein
MQGIAVLAMGAPKHLTDPARVFLEPVQTRHRQYEALRAYFVEHRPSADVARAFGYTPASFRVLCHQFRRNPQRVFFVEPSHGPQEQPKKSRARRLIIQMRKRNLSVYDIADALRRRHVEISPTAVAEVLREEGFAKLPRRADDERPDGVLPDVAERADVRRFTLGPTCFDTHMGGLFVLLPLVVKLGLDRLAVEARLPGTKTLPALQALLSALALKLTSIERKSHVMDLVFDEGLALFAGLNVVPKATFFAQYAGRFGRSTSVRLLRVWLEHLRGHLALEGASFDLDFHTVPFFGEDEFIERHYLPRRSHRDKAVLTFIVQDADTDVLCYSNADLRKGEEADEILRFVAFWKETHGKLPSHMVFDSKLTTYKTLARLNAMGITFITLRQRFPALKRYMQNAPAGAWRRVELDAPHRKFRHPKVLDEILRLGNDYTEPVRQICARDCYRRAWRVPLSPRSPGTGSRWRSGSLAAAWRGRLSGLNEIPVAAVVSGNGGGAVVQRDDQVGAKPRALGAGEQRSRSSLRGSRVRARVCVGQPSRGRPLAAFLDGLAGSGSPRAR